MTETPITVDPEGVFCAPRKCQVDPSKRKSMKAKTFKQNVRLPVGGRASLPEAFLNCLDRFFFVTLMKSYTSLDTVRPLQPRTLLLWRDPSGATPAAEVNWKTLRRGNAVVPVRPEPMWKMVEWVFLRIYSGVRV